MASSIASSNVENLRHADDRPERLGRVDLVLGGHADHQRRVVEDPRVGVADEALARVDAVIRPRADEPCTVWWSRISPSQSSKRSAKRSWIIGPYSTSAFGSPIGADDSRSDSFDTNSSYTDSCTIAVPSDVQRCPAVPKPPNSAPSTARSTSASSITTIGFLPPSSRHGDWTWRPHSSPIFEPTALETGEPDLVDQALFKRRRQPVERVRTRRLHDVQHAARHAARMEQPHQRVAQRRAVLRRLPHDRVAAQDRRHQVPRGHGHREVARGDDRRHADRHAEREELLVRHLRRHRLPVQPPPLAEEEVARVDDLLDLAERLRIRLADLARDQRGQRLLVGLDQPPDLRDHPPARGRGHRRPLLLRGARGARGVHEGRGVPEQHLGDDVVQPGRVRGGQAAARSVAAGSPPTIEATVVAATVEDMTEDASAKPARLQRVDRRDVDRVGAAQDRRVDRDEIAEQHERDEPLDPRRTARAARAAPAPRPPPRCSAVSSARSTLRGCASASSSDT